MVMDSTEVTTAEKFTATERLWLTADRERVVKDGDPQAAFLFATPGKKISAEDVERFGLKARKRAPENKAMQPDEDKAVAAEEDAAAQPAEEEAPTKPKRRPAARKAAK